MDSAAEMYKCSDEAAEQKQSMQCSSIACRAASDSSRDYASAEQTHGETLAAADTSESPPAAPAGPDPATPPPLSQSAAPAAAGAALGQREAAPRATLPVLVRRGKAPPAPAQPTPRAAAESSARGAPSCVC